MLRHDDGTPLTVRQAVDTAWEQFGPAAVLECLAARLSWSARYEPTATAVQQAADAEALARIGERLARQEAAEHS